MKAFISLGEKLLNDKYDRLAAVSLLTARRYWPELQINCVWEGSLEHDFVKFIKDLGVTVVQNPSWWAEEIRKRVAERKLYYHCLVTYNKLWGLYLDTPDSHVMMLDVDTMVVQRPPSIPTPEFFAAAPESDPNDWRFVNTGVTVLNVQNMRSPVEDALRRGFEFNLDWSRYTLSNTYDQGLLNSLPAFSSVRWERLPLEWNWKPYWGKALPYIIHFHGPKPQDIRRFHETGHIIPEYVAFLSDFYDQGLLKFWTDRWFKILDEIPRYKQ